MSATPSTRSHRKPVNYAFLNTLIVSLYRLTGGVIGGRIGRNPTLLLTTVGRRSGRPHTVPLTYFQDGDRLALVASNAGSDRHPA